MLLSKQRLDFYSRNSINTIDSADRIYFNSVPYQEKIMKEKTLGRLKMISFSCSLGCAFAVTPTVFIIQGIWFLLPVGISLFSFVMFVALDYKRGVDYNENLEDREMGD